MAYDILEHLAKDGTIWAITPSQHAWSTLNPDRLSPSVLVTLKMANGQELQMHRRPHQNNAPEYAIAGTLKALAPDHPGLLAWFDSHGNYPVHLKEGVFECIPEAMHTALRKLADSKQSVITWNAIHQMKDSDCEALWNDVTECLTKAFENKPNTNRRGLARSLQSVVTESLERSFSDSRSTRTPAQSFALMAMSAACSLTEIDEWMYGWLGYVVEEAPEDKETASETPQAAAEHPAA